MCFSPSLSLSLLYVLSFFESIQDIWSHGFKRWLSTSIEFFNDSQRCIPFSVAFSLVYYHPQTRNAHASCHPLKKQSYSRKTESIARFVAWTAALGIFATPASSSSSRELHVRASPSRSSRQLQPKSVPPLVRSSLRISKLSRQLRRYVYTVQLSLGQTGRPITRWRI